MRRGVVRGGEATVTACRSFCGLCAGTDATSVPQRSDSYLFARRDGVVRPGGEVALGVQGRHATGAGCGDGLHVLVVDDVSAGEHAGQGRTRAAPLDLDEAAVCEPNLVGEQLGARVV